MKRNRGNFISVKKVHLKILLTGKLNLFFQYIIFLFKKEFYYYQIIYYPIILMALLDLDLVQRCLPYDTDGWPGLCWGYFLS